MNVGGPWLSLMQLTVVVGPSYGISHDSKEPGVDRGSNKSGIDCNELRFPLTLGPTRTISGLEQDQLVSSYRQVSQDPSPLQELH
jgi:hypothetical protein